MTPTTKGKNAQIPRSQATISTYFTPNNSPVKTHTKKRTASPIDLTIDSDDNVDSPIAKKPKTSKWSYVPEAVTVGSGSFHAQLNAASTLEERQRTSPVRQSPPILAKTRGLSDEAARKGRREAFKKRLLGENNSFIKRTSSVDGGSRSMDVEEDDHSKNQETVHVDGSGDESDEAFNDLKKMFSNPQAKEKMTRKGQRKGKAPATTNAKSRQEEATPSGQEYTPLEKQVNFCRSDCCKPHC
jgi:DNA mismatch repair protein MSH3